MERNTEIKNNIFDFATKKLSQDALICWLINGIKYKEDKELYKKAEKILKYIFEKKGIDICLENYEFEIRTQYSNIDILVLAKRKEDLAKNIENVEYALIIEDKKLTTIHNEQLERYTDKIKKKYELEDNHIIKVYYKPYEELNKIKADVNLDRKYMLDNIFNDSNITNEIYSCYRAYLNEIEGINNKFEEIPIKEWSQNRAIFYSFAKKYNEKSKDEKEEMKVVQVRGSTYIDWYGKDVLDTNEYKKFIKGIYLCLNVNYDRF